MENPYIKGKLAIKQNFFPVTQRLPGTWHQLHMIDKHRIAFVCSKPNAEAANDIIFFYYTPPFKLKLNDLLSIGSQKLNDTWKRKASRFVVR